MQNIPRIITEGDEAALQAARRKINLILDAMHERKRGDDWHQRLRHTHSALIFADLLLTAVVVGDHDAYVGHQLRSVAQQIDEHLACTAAKSEGGR